MNINALGSIVRARPLSSMLGEHGKVFSRVWAYVSMCVCPLVCICLSSQVFFFSIQCILVALWQRGQHTAETLLSRGKENISQCLS
jgi:hypothetical protein